MPGLGRIAWLLAAVAAAALALAALAGARGSPVKVKVSTEKGGPAIDHATINHKAKDFWVSIKNIDDHQLEITADDRSTQDPEGNFKIRWFRGDRNVTQEMKAGIEFALDVGDRRIYRARVKPLVDDPGEACLAGGFAIQPDNFDAVGIVYINSTSICG